MIFEYGIFFLLIGFLAILRFKSVFIKLILFVYWYPLLTMYLFCSGVPLGGSIDVIGRHYYVPFAKEAFAYAVSGYFIFVMIIWKVKNDKLELIRFMLPSKFRNIIAVLFFIISVIAYPKAFHISEQRWNLFPGPWLVFAISLNSLLLLSFSKFKGFAFYTHVIVLLITFVGGERVNTIVALLYFLLIAKSDALEGVLTEKKINTKTIIVICMLVFLGIAAQFWRSGVV